MNTDSKASWQAVQIDPDEYQGRWPALIVVKNVAEKLGVRDVHNYPRGLGTIDLGKISSDPFGLSIGDGEGARVLRSPFRRVWGDKSMSKICLCVVLHKMRHSVIERVPEVPNSTRLVTGHAKMVNESGEVSLAGHTDACRIASSAAVIAVGFMISRTNHPWFGRRDRSHLVIEFIENGLIDFITVLNCGVWFESLDLLL